MEVITKRILLWLAAIALTGWLAREHTELLFQCLPYTIFTIGVIAVLWPEKKTK